MSKTILLIGTLDTKGAEFGYIKDLIKNRGFKTLVLDAGVIGEPTIVADISAKTVAKVGGCSLKSLREKADRGRALEVMTDGVTRLALQYLKEGNMMVY